MNLNKRLSELFDKHNIIFWYDDGGGFKDEFDSLKLEAKKLVIDNNEFSLKYEILTAPKHSKFLVYSEKNKPEDKDNWLLDILLRGYLFSADRASMVLSDLGIDIIYKPFIQNHLNFFEAKKRVEPFVKLLEKDDNEYKMAIKMIASLLRCEPKIESIIIKLIQDEKKYDYSIKKIIPVKEPNLKTFEEIDKQNRIEKPNYKPYEDLPKPTEIINQVLTRFKNWNSNAISELSHEDTPYKAAKNF